MGDLVVDSFDEPPIENVLRQASQELVEHRDLSAPPSTTCI